MSAPNCPKGLKPVRGYSTAQLYTGNGTGCGAVAALGTSTGLSLKIPGNLRGLASFRDQFDVWDVAGHQPLRPALEDECRRMVPHHDKTRRRGCRIHGHAGNPAQCLAPEEHRQAEILGATITGRRRS